MAQTLLKTFAYILYKQNKSLLQANHVLTSHNKALKYLKSG